MEERKRDIYPIELIKSGVSILKLPQNKKWHEEFWRPFVVYQLIPMDHNREMLLPVGRDYKPIGLSGGDKWVLYEDFPYLLIPENRVKKDLLDATGILTYGYFFFSDSTAPNTKKNIERYIDLVERVFGIKI